MAMTVLGPMRCHGNADMAMTSRLDERRRESARRVNDESVPAPRGVTSSVIEMTDGREKHMVCDVTLTIMTNKK